MIEIENAIIAAVIEFPKLAYLAVENLGPSDFSNSDNRKIFERINVFFNEKEEITWIKLVAFLQGKLKEPMIGRLMEYTYGLHKMGSQAYIKDNIRTLKKETARRALLEEIEAQAKSPFCEMERIIEIAERGIYITSKEESGDFKVALDEYLESRKKKSTNIYTGYPSFDKNIGDLLCGELVGIMARTSVGKTFFALNIIDHILNHANEKLGLFSQEMSKVSIIERISQLHFGTTRWELMEKVENDSLNWDGCLEKFRNRLEIYSQIYSTSEISRIVERDELKVIFIDYLQLMKKTKGRSLYEATTYQMAELKEIAKNKNVLIFLMIQLSRKAEGGWEAVTIDMARESGAIEENCDFLIGLWNPSLKEKANQKYKGRLTVSLLKNKRGPQVTISCIFNQNTGKIWEAAHEKETSNEK